MHISCTGGRSIRGGHIKGGTRLLGFDCEKRHKEAFARRATFVFKARADSRERCCTNTRAQDERSTDIRDPDGGGVCERSARGPGPGDPYREPDAGGPEPRRLVQVGVRVGQRDQGERGGPGEKRRRGERGDAGPGRLQLQGRRRRRYRPHLHRRRERLPAPGRPPAHAPAHPRGHPEGPRVERRAPRARGEEQGVTPAKTSCSRARHSEPTAGRASPLPILSCYTCADQYVDAYNSLARSHSHASSSLRISWRVVPPSTVLRLLSSLESHVSIRNFRYPTN